LAEKFQSAKAAETILHEVLPPPAQLRCAELRARREDDI